ncbi:MAG: hypothetical protein IT452_07870 [Planctomycetia bacterium]|nr:hypothetical protein [Planctomycetia bacterium]
MDHDVAVAWDWEHDEAFVADLERACRARGMTFRSVTPATVDADLATAAEGRVRWKLLLDRAWESDPRFLRLNDTVAAAGTRLLNRPELSARMGNKAAAHALLAGKGVALPRLVDFMPSEWSDFALARATEGWRRPLWIKPACGGGGDGVLALEEVPARFPLGVQWDRERCVLQEDAAPLSLDGRPAWFRAVHVLGTIHLFWWHPQTHVFATVTAAEAAAHGLGCVTDVARAVAAHCELEIFSSEVSLVAPGVPLLVDPVNDPVDFRRRSRAADGIPDEGLAAIVEAAADGLRALLADL